MEMRIYVLLILIGILSAAVLLLGTNEQPENFVECVEAGGFIMKSKPRQCEYRGNIFVEPSCSHNTHVMTLYEAEEIARNSECGDRLTGEYNYNEASGTYWLDLNIQKEGCNPACVVNIEHRNATINWRCMGLNVE
ncbi:MAG: hypothetical protein ABEK17_02005 [Candidatus Aenigmatarchaeota archaeon]